jgi:Ca2+/Na+ antiporter
MTRITNARIAGCTLLLYIAVGITQMILSGRASQGEGTATRLASMAQHATDVRVGLLLGLLTCLIALALGVALYAITREQDHDLALLALTCRIGEGVLGAIFISITLGLLSIATSAAANAREASAVQTLGLFILTARRWNPVIAAVFFAVGSTLFSWLLLRGRMIPVALAWLGLFASLLLVIGLPLQLAGVLRGAVTQLMWLPMAAFEIPLGLWLLIKGVAMPPLRQPS